MDDRANAVCDLLMGAAFADNELHDAERETVEKHLASLMPEGALSDELKERISGFTNEAFDLEAVAARFADDSKEDRKALLEIVASVHAADDEYDLDEDDYILAVAKALGLGREDVAAHALEYEVEQLKDSMAKVRSAPPPAPKE